MIRIELEVGLGETMEELRDETQVKDTPRAAGWKLAAVFVLTGLWAVVVAYLVWETIRVSPQGDCGSWLPCLELNEWGDLLAGIFAPVAFLWLVATVLIQSDELREQRKELALTRQEMKYSRDVMKEQAEEARAQAIYLGRQTDLLNEEAVQRRSESAFAQFQSLIDIYITSSCMYYGDIFIAENTFTSRLFRRDAIDALRYVSRHYDDIQEIVPNIEMKKVELVNPNFFIILFKYLYAADELLPRIPYAQRLAWKVSMLPEIVDWYCNLVSACEQLAELQGYVDARRRRKSSDGFDDAPLLRLMTE
ncbi:hypothetical protein CFBP5507_04415 [Agrobacterium salinitolerans]|uniref:Uncharacterized protein n=1 Tax=Agrobacterium salinitolerans TaxID=1183413 RepID=A0A4Z1R599_9HYPH|nr:hypothetical protein [Agrobacterium salinitolerans]UYZ08257.1 hypothetical protein CFBP5507_04415 [Agrobacterium salinitolerans]